jgi:hypothetical protein
MKDASPKSGIPSPLTIPKREDGVKFPMRRRGYRKKDFDGLEKYIYIEF